MPTSPTTPAAVPTKAPSAQASDQQSKPTAIVSSNTAADHTTGVIIPTMNKAASAIVAQNTANANPDTAYWIRPGETTASYNARVAQYNTSKNATPTTQTPSQPSPEQQIADTPDAGNQWAYLPNGEKYQVPVGQVPQGSSATNPSIPPAKPVTGTAQLDSGDTIQEFQDGTYGRVDSSGKYIGGSTASEFQDAQTTQQLKNSLLQVVNGTYPLSAAQQAQVDGLKAQFADLINQQTLANKNLTGGTTVAENLYGMGNTISGLGEIKGTVDSGIQKIVSLNAQMSSAVASMEQSFQDNNMKMLQSAYDMFNNAQKDRQTEIDKMQAASVAAAKDARDYNRQVQVDAQNTAHQNLQDNIASIQLSDKEKQDAIQNAFQQGQITETQRHDLQTEAVARQTAMKGRYQLDSATGQVFDSTTGKMIASANPANVMNGAVEPGNTGNPLLDNNTKTSPGGVPYIDGTTFTGKQSQTAQLDAAKMGIPYLGKTGVEAMANIQAVKDNLGAIKSSVSDLNPSNGLTRPFVSLGHGFESVTQMGSGADEVGSFKTYRSAAIKAIEGLAVGGAGLRINQAEIHAMMDSLPTYNDTQDVAQAKLAKLDAMLNANEKSIVGSQVYDKYNPDGAATDLAGFAKASPEHQAQVDQVRQAQPNLTPYQVLQVVQP